MSALFLVLCLCIQVSLGCSRDYGCPGFAGPLDFPRRFGYQGINIPCRHQGHHHHGINIPCRHHEHHHHGIGPEGSTYGDQEAAPVPSAEGSFIRPPLLIRPQCNPQENLHRHPHFFPRPLQEEPLGCPNVPSQCPPFNRILRPQVDFSGRIEQDDCPDRHPQFIPEQPIHRHPHMLPHGLLHRPHHGIPQCNHQNPWCGLRPLNIGHHGGPGHFVRPTHHDEQGDFPNAGVGPVFNSQDDERRVNIPDPTNHNVCLRHYIVKKVRPVYDECIKRVPLIQNVVRQKCRSVVENVPVETERITARPEESIVNLPVIKNQIRFERRQRTRTIPIKKTAIVPALQNFLIHVPVRESVNQPVIERRIINIPQIQYKYRPVVEKKIVQYPVERQVCEPVVERRVITVPIKSLCRKHLVQDTIARGYGPCRECDDCE